MKIEIYVKPLLGNGMWNELQRRQTLDKQSVAKLRNSGTRLCSNKESGVVLNRAEPRWLLSSSKQLSTELPSNTSVNTASRNSEASCVFRLSE